MGRQNTGRFNVAGREECRNCKKQGRMKTICCCGNELEWPVIALKQCIVVHF